jgi:ketosteroid isomerase-like protein
VSPDGIVQGAAIRSAKEQGDYLTVFRRQKDGKWLIIQQVWTFAGNDVIPQAK